MPTPDAYAIAPGMDRCDTCFFRSKDGQSCEKHGMGVADGYAPNMKCDEFAPRSSGQYYKEDNKGEGTPAVLPDGGSIMPLSQRITGVEIFRVGEWNGHKYTSKDLDLILAAFPKVGYKPPVKLGHDEDPTAPAYGWVENLRREGDVLVADFADVPDDLVEQIKERRYDAVSSELYHNLTRDGEKFPRALRAVAILGAHPPGVSDLKSLRDAVAGFAVDGATFWSCDLPREARKDEMPVPGGGAPAGDAAGAELTLKLQEAADKIAALEAKLTEREKATEGASTAALLINQLQEKVQFLEEQRQKDAAETRRMRIKEVVDDCRVPALRKHLQALAELATAGDDAQTRTVNFAIGDGADAKAVPTDAMEVIRDFVSRLNQRVNTLFREGVKGGDTAVRTFEEGHGEDAGQAIMAKISAYVASHPGIDMATAQKAVFADPANRELVQRYNFASLPE